MAHFRIREHAVTMRISLYMGTEYLPQPRLLGAPHVSLIYTRDLCRARLMLYDFCGANDSIPAIVGAIFALLMLPATTRIIYTIKCQALMNAMLLSLKI